MAKKDCYLIDSNDDNSIAIYVSIDALADLGKFVLKKPDKKKKLYFVVNCLYSKNTNKSTYEEYNDYKGTATLKLGRGQDNIRVYCKVEQVTTENFNQKRITIHKIWNKKVQQLSNKEINFLKAIQKQEFKYGRFIS